MALLDTGIIAMKSMPIASTILLLQKPNTQEQKQCEYFLDPVAEEESSLESTAVVLVTTNKTNNIQNKKDDVMVLASMTIGPISSLDTYLACIEAASRTNQAVLAFIRLAMEQKVTREAKTLWSI